MSPASVVRTTLVGEWRRRDMVLRITATDILRRYADAWRGRRELDFEGSLTVAFWIDGERGGEYHTILTPAAGVAVRDGVPAEYHVGFETNIDFPRRLDRWETERHDGDGTGAF